jgi:iron complex transport system substrate-binding protein
VISRAPAILAAMLCLGWQSWAAEPAGETKGPRRIVSFVPHATEIIFTLGAEDRLLGVGSSCRWPDETRLKPQLGGVFDLQIEKVISLEPDLAILGRSHVLHRRLLKKEGIETLTLDTDSINDGLRTIRDLSIRLGLEKTAKPLVENMVEELNALYRQGKRKPSRPTLLCLAHGKNDLSRIVALTPRNYLDEILTAAGGKNVVAPSAEHLGLGMPMTPEEVRQAKPLIVIDLAPPEAGADDRRRVEALWRELFEDAPEPPLRLYVVREPYLGVPGPGMADSIRTLYRLIHFD